MKTFQQYILEDADNEDWPPLESRSQELSPEHLRQLLTTKCKKNVEYILKTGNMIYRGVYGYGRPRGGDAPRLIQPSKFTRRSMNTENYYTWIIDNDPIWGKFPKRSKSLICTSNAQTADSYGNLHVVIPFDGAKIATVGETDIWSALDFPLDLQHDGGGASTINTIIESIFKILKTYPTNYESFVDACGLIDNLGQDEILKISRQKGGRYSEREGIQRFFRDLEYNENVKPFYDTLVQGLYYPRKGMHVLKCDDQGIYTLKQEVWTSSDCILIPSSVRITGDNYTNELIKSIKSLV